ncbi:hypothetical protein GCM10010441_39820 [Kitasatospora paracochleata]|uniref:DUF5753 domain-containing protein n=1 Tax=Kitasatospora paracochleata TaxID=58354 RepID=A0ABT1IVY6_9ACTN|nr:Scr1 family TA system antitoxin-like transcriptional regulator [Kitasatospora paracochleata]MCP2309297.1 hypothetical protein [Kitasatospora paracochleata]
MRTGNHRFAILVEESVLYYRLGTVETMAEQLEHLRDAMALPAVLLGVIPFTPQRTMWPMETFNIFDDAEAGVELLSAQVTVTAPGQVSDPPCQIGLHR